MVNLFERLQSTRLGLHILATVGTVPVKSEMPVKCRHNGLGPVFPNFYTAGW